ncbi:MAG: hypothetical protein AAF642_11885 [Pseudomonadota bacterium]
MSAQPEVVPMTMEIDDPDVDDEFEARGAETEEDPFVEVLGVLKSPIGLAGLGGAVVLLAAIGFLFGSGTVENFGKPKPNTQSSDTEGSIASFTTSVALEQVDLNVKRGATASDGDARSSEESALGGADRRDMQEEMPAPTYGEISYTENGAIYHTAPTTILVQIGDRQKELTLSLGILADRASARQLKQDALTVNVLTIEAAQSVDLGPYLDWEIPGLITKDLRTRIDDEFPDANIRAIMIRDFQL